MDPALVLGERALLAFVGVGDLLVVGQPLSGLGPFGNLLSLPGRGQERHQGKTTGRKKITHVTTFHVFEIGSFRLVVDDGLQLGDLLL